MPDESPRSTSAWTPAFAGVTLWSECKFLPAVVPIRNAPESAVAGARIFGQGAVMAELLASIGGTDRRVWAWRGAKLFFSFVIILLASQMTPIEAFTSLDRPGGIRVQPAGRAAVPTAVAADGGAFQRLVIGRQMLHGDYVWQDEGVPPGRIEILIDLSAQTLSVIRGGHEIGRAVMLYGTDENPTPTGSFTILEKDADHVSNLYDAIMPYMLRLTRDGVAIHGSNVRYGWASRGCIGVPDEFAALLFAQARVGDRVTIVGEPAPAASPEA